MLLAWFSCSFNEVEYGSGSSLSSAGTRLRPHCWWADRPGSCCQTRSSRYLQVEIRKRGSKIRFWYSRCTVMMQKEKKRHNDVVLSHLLWTPLSPEWRAAGTACSETKQERFWTPEDWETEKREKRQHRTFLLWLILNGKKCLVKIILKSKTYE